jgi:hypothetical protein
VADVLSSNGQERTPVIAPPTLPPEQVQIVKLAFERVVKPLPRELTHPLEVYCGVVWGELDLTIENAKRDGAAVQFRKESSQSGGSIQPADAGRHLVHGSGKDRQGKPKQILVPHRYDILLNDQPRRESRYSSLTHELGHLYCGHQGTPNRKWWPDRRGLDKTTREFEAESVAYLVCGRLGIETPSAEYLAGYLQQNLEVPAISIDSVMKAAGTIEKMGQKRLEPREEEE